MTATVQVSLSGTPIPATLYDAIQLLEVEENADRPDALLLRLPVNRTSGGDLQYVGDGTFEPSTNVTVLVTPADQPSQCIFDGYVLSWKLHLDRTSGSSTIDVWAEDASWLMNMSDTVREWTGMTDGEVANQIFSSYGFTTADGNTDDDSPQHDPDAHSLFQRATDLQFLRGLARRNGKLCRVACTDTPGARTGYFVAPAVDGEPAATISLVDPETWSVDSLDFDWDVMRPTEVDASQVPIDDDSEDSVDGNATDSGLAALDERDYPAYAGQTATLLLTAAADAPELTLRTAATLREAGWFVRCRGETTVDRLGAMLRVGSVVTIEGAGSLHSGNWLVWSVRTQITVDIVRIQFTLLRNAMGPAPAGGLPGGLPGGL
jgi:phage protein D